MTDKRVLCWWLKRLKDEGENEMNTQHTPGPWEAVTDMYGTLVIRAPVPTCSWDYHLIATIQKGDCAKASATLIAAAPDMATELARGRAALCALRYWVPEDLLPAVNRVIVNMAHAIGKATGDCLPEADGRTEEAARATIEEAAK